MVLKQLKQYGMRMLIATVRMLIATVLIVTAALQDWSLGAMADDVQSAVHETSNVMRSKQVLPVSGESAGGCGVAKVPGCANGTGMPCAAGVCGPQGCAPGGGWGPCGCPSCRAARAPGRPQQVDLYTFRDAGQACSGAGRSCRQHAFGWASPENDWNDELGNGQCREHGRAHCSRCSGWWANQWALFNCRNHQQGAILHAHIHGKLAYFQPMGNGGQGAPPFGCYHLVYAANPSYADPRDSQVYAAQGWGVPISVPLAPTVRHTMNYSNGIPSSRLTPISNVVPPSRGRDW